MTAARRRLWGPPTFPFPLDVGLAGGPERLMGLGGEKIWDTVCRAVLCHAVPCRAMPSGGLRGLPAVPSCCQALALPSPGVAAAGGSCSAPVPPSLSKTHPRDESPPMPLD